MKITHRSNGSNTITVSDAELCDIAMTIEQYHNVRLEILKNEGLDMSNNELNWCIRLQDRLGDLRAGFCKAHNDAAWRNQSKV